MKRKTVIGLRGAKGRRKEVAAAEMAALCALCARHGLASPYGGTGWTAGPDLKMAKQMERAAVSLVVKALTEGKQ